MAWRDYLRLIAEMEVNLDRFGDSYRGVGWTKKKEYADLRYRIMLDVIRREPGRGTSLLDFGCGASHLYEYILAEGINDIDYAGLDLSAKYLSLCRQKFPHLVYHDVDLLAPTADLPTYDYVILNGIFIYRRGVSYNSMWEYCQSLLSRISDVAREGFAFNVISKHVDWERDDLFHVPIEAMTTFLSENISRHFVIRHDYGLYEYTVYVYKRPLSAQATPDE